MGQEHGNPDGSAAASAQQHLRKTSAQAATQRRKPTCQSRQQDLTWVLDQLILCSTTGKDDSKAHPS